MTPIDKLFDLYQQAEHMDYIGEPVSQLVHMQQAAWHAQQAGADEELILAAFFHDLGHICAAVNAPQMDGLGVIDHEYIGGRFLQELGFSERVASLVSLHVQAKRYLCWKKPNYYRNLSLASRGTLEFQGGPMNDAQAKEFEEHPYHRDILRLRVWDEAAKEIDGDRLSLPRLKEMAISHLAQQYT